jgi:hypothetical protein
VRPAGMHGEQHAERATSRDAWRAACGACDQPLKTFYFVSGAQFRVMTAFLFAYEKDSF